MDGVGDPGVVRVRFAGRPVRGGGDDCVVVADCCANDISDWRPLA